MTRGLYYIDDEERLENLSEKYKDRIAGHNARILLPFYDRDKNLIGITGRLIQGEGLRYLTLKFNAENEPLIFGLENLDDRSHIYVVEGPLDSLLLCNAVAVAGADFSKLDSLVDKKNATIIFDNEPRNKEIVKRMEKMISSGWEICIWPKNILEKDINDMIIAGQSSEQILDVINRNKFSDLQAAVALNNWRKC